MIKNNLYTLTSIWMCISSIKALTLIQLVLTNWAFIHYFSPSRHQTLSDNSYRYFPQYTCLQICAKLRLFYTLLAKYNSCTQSIDAELKRICYMRASFLFTCNQFRIRQTLYPITECMPFIQFVVLTRFIHICKDFIIEHNRCSLIVT